MSTKTSRVLILIAFAIGAFFIALQGIKMLLMLFDPEVPGSVKEWLGYGAVLGIGWAVLLLISTAGPFKRKFILLISLIPILGSVLTNNIVHNQQAFELWYYWFSLIAPILIGGFYLFVFFFAREREKNDIPENK